MLLLLSGWLEDIRKFFPQRAQYRFATILGLAFVATVVLGRGELFQPGDSKNSLDIVAGPAPPKLDSPEASKGANAPRVADPSSITIKGRVSDAYSKPVQDASVWLTALDDLGTPYPSDLQTTNSSGTLKSRQPR